MNIHSESAKILRRWAAAAVAGNVAVTVFAAALLPASAQTLLPVIGLTLPLLTTGVLDAAVQRHVDHRAS